MQQAQVATHFDDGDARRKAGRSLVRMRIVNERTPNLVIGENTRLESLGECEVLVWENEVKGVLAMVEDEPGEMEVARRSFEMDVARLVLEKLTQTPHKDASPAEVLELVKAGKTPVVTAAWESALKQTPLSPEGHFHRMKGRDVRPLSKAEVLERNVPSPYQLQEVAHAKMVAGIMNGSGASKK